MGHGTPAIGADGLKHVARSGGGQIAAQKKRNPRWVPLCKSFLGLDLWIGKILGGQGSPGSGSGRGGAARTASDGHADQERRDGAAGKHRKLGMVESQDGTGGAEADQGEDEHGPGPEGPAGGREPGEAERADAQHLKEHDQQLEHGADLHVERRHSEALPGRWGIPESFPGGCQTESSLTAEDQGNWCAKPGKRARFGVTGAVQVENLRKKAPEPGVLAPGMGKSYIASGIFTVRWRRTRRARWFYSK